MSEEMIVKHCSPTLAGLKTGNLFSCSYQDRNELITFLREWNTKLRSKGVRMIPLRLDKGKALIYVYRPSQLSKDFNDVSVCNLLSRCGYCTESCEKCVVELMKRIRHSKDFPHEIGLFLGYPCEDVKGFIENKAARAKCVGCWKVYGDAERAQKQFEIFKKCIKVYQKQWNDGKSLSKLTVTL